MAFPTQAYAHAGNNANTTTHNWTLPSGAAAGKLLVVIVCVDGTPTIDFSASGLTSFGSQADGTNATVECFYRFLVGGEASGTFTTSASEQSSVHAFIFTDAHASTLPEVAFSTGSDTSWDAPSLNPSNWGTEDTQWIALVCTSDGTNESVSVSDPAGFTFIDAHDTTGTSAGVQVRLSYIDENAASKDPASASLDSGASYVALTLGIRPAGAAASAPEIPLVFMPQVRHLTLARKTSMLRGGHGVAFFEPLYTSSESITLDKFDGQYPAVMRKKRWRPSAEYALTDVPVLADVVEHGWEFSNTQALTRWRARRNYLAGSHFSLPSQDPLTLAYQTILGRTTIDPSYIGLSDIYPSYEGESGTNVEGE